MDKSIKILVKPDCVSWDDIHDVIWKSHEENRRNGITMRYPSLPGSEIEKKLGTEGKMIVALTEEGKLVGTAAMMPKKAKLWFGEHVFAYCCFASILPDYSGKGIYKEMCRLQEEMAREKGLTMMMFDTHEKNYRNLGHSQKAGYKSVDFKFYRDHYNVVMVKWLNGCPYSRFQCSLNYLLKCLVVKIRSFRQVHKCNTPADPKN